LRRAALLVAGVAFVAMLGCGEGGASGTKGSPGGGAGMGMAGSSASTSGTSGSAGRMSGGASGSSLGGASAGSGAGAGGASAGSSQAGAGSSSGAGTTGAAGGTSGTSAGGASRGGASTGSGGAAGSTSAGAGSGTAGMAGDNGGSSGPLNVLVFSRTQGFRHDSIPDGVSAFTKLATQNGWGLMATEDPAVFSDAKLASVNVVVFMSTTGDVLDEGQQAAFERFIRAGGGFVGVHSATDTEYDWAFYGELAGAYFREHPAIQEATVVVEDSADPILAGIPARWTRTDEWYAFKTNPRPNVHVLMSLDESSYEPGTSAMDGDHPITWLHEYEGGRAFYTALGHTEESYTDPLFVGMLERAVEWAAGG
jgi:type 1 glutamine amidotransferase